MSRGRTSLPTSWRKLLSLTSYVFVRVSEPRLLEECVLFVLEASQVGAALKDYFTLLIFTYLRDILFTKVDPVRIECGQLVTGTMDSQDMLVATKKSVRRLRSGRIRRGWRRQDIFRGGGRRIHLRYMRRGWTSQPARISPVSKQKTVCRHMIELRLHEMSNAILDGSFRQKAWRGGDSQHSRTATSGVRAATGVSLVERLGCTATLSRLIAGSTSEGATQKLEGMVVMRP
jgi:hypothetical protein